MSVGVLAAAMQAAVSGAGGGGGGGDIYWPQVSLSLPLTADFSDAAGGGSFTATGASITGGGAVCDGVNDIFRRAAGIAWAFGRSDYTVEGFLKQNGAGSVQCFFDTRTASKEGVALYTKSGFAGGITLGISSALVAGVATEFSTSVRQHWALVREGTTTRFYLDGVQLFTYTDARLLVGSAACTFGDNYLGPASQPAACDQNHIRMTRGVCRYPGGTTFTPPVGPFDTAGGTDPGTGPGAHRYWRLLITASESASFHGMTELRLFDRDGVLVSGYNAGVTGSISASSSINGGNIDYLAFDENLTSSGWLSATAGTEWIKQDMQHSDQVIGVPVEIKDVHIYGSYNSPTSSPKDFKLQWSDDNSSWTDALVVTGETGWAANELRTFAVF